VLEPQGIV